jgi:UDP-N-acetylmuramate--alanine ligase
VTLRQPVPLLPVGALGRVHFIAIGGTGMSGVARLYLESGVAVTGSDQADSAELRALAAAGADVWVGHDAARMGRPDTVVFSTAIKESNPEYAAAVAQGARLWHRSTALAALMLGRRGLAVAGTHGKTTTSGMVVTALAAAGLDPSYCIGSPLAGGTSAELGAGEWFAVEADESDGSFLQYPAELAIVTTLDADHLDNWGTPEHYRAGFGRFTRGEGVRWVVASADDPGARALAESLRADGRHVVTFGAAADADVRLTNIELKGLTPSATLQDDGVTVDLTLQVPGRHNLQNAAAAFAAGLLLGASPAALAAGLHSFRGTSRRFEPKGVAAGVAVFDDYAHHPAEIAATLAAARSVLAPPGRLIAAFQPHLFSRTQQFAHEFGAALAAADVAVVTDVYPAREAPVPGVTGELVADAVADCGGTVTYVPELDAVAPALAALARPGDLVLTLGAGSITNLGPEVVALLEAR